MAKARKKSTGWFKSLIIALVVILCCGGIGFGVFKLVEHFKPVEEPPAQEQEQTPENPEEAPEEEPEVEQTLANSMVA